MSDKRKKVILDLMDAEFYVPMKEKELAVMLQVSKEDRGELNRILNELLAEGSSHLPRRESLSRQNTQTENLLVLLSVIQRALALSRLRAEMRIYIFLRIL